MSSMYGNQGMGNKIPKGYSAGRIQQFTPEMMQLFNSLFSHVGPESYLSRLAGGDEEIFKQIEGPAMRQFSGQLGNLASRFSGMGQGARHSSGFQNTATSAASDFAQDLQSKRQGLTRQALMDLMSSSQMLLGQRPYENFLTKKPDFLSQLFGGGGDILGMLSKLAPLFMG
jgi:hypothetical protein